MYPFEPGIPPNWKDLALRFSSTGPDFHWLDNAKRLLALHGPAALVVPDVQDLVLRATGNTTSPLISEEYLSRVPEREWALKHAWSQRRTAGNLWSAMEDLRSIHAELGVLICFGVNGFSVVKDDALEARDWIVCKNSRAHSIEVKAKGDSDAKLDFAHCAFVGQQLIDPSGFLRRYYLNYYAMDEAMKDACPERLHWLARVIAIVAPEVAYKVPTTLEEVELDIGSSEGRAVLRGHPGGWFLTLHSDDGWRLSLHASIVGFQWAHSYLRSHASHVLSQLSCERRRGIARILSRTVSSNLAQLLKSSSLYIVLWPAPLAWDDVLADNDTHAMQILELVTSRVESKKGAPVPLGIWGESFGRYGGRILLNSPARLLLQTETLATRPY